MFAWLQFLKVHNIDFVLQGPNVARGNCNIRCPWCGSADSSHHLGISLEFDSWGCWRNRSHRGRKPHKLIQALIKCSYNEAARIVGDDRIVVLNSDDTFGDMVAGMMKPVEALPAVKAVEWLPEIRTVARAGMLKMFFEYLEDRDYERNEVRDLIRLYDLRCALRGPFKYRLIFPIYMKEGLVTWTGRAINKDALVRYKTLTHNAEKAEEQGLAPATLPIDQTLWNYGALAKTFGRTLVVCEGPFDALRVDYYGRQHDIRATCVFGTGNISATQIQLLDELAPKFKKKYLALDPDAELTSFQKVGLLDYLGFKPISIGKKYEDPAVLPPRKVIEFFS